MKYLIMQYIAFVKIFNLEVHEVKITAKQVKTAHISLGFSQNF